jgi:hypothetical protein
MGCARDIVERAGAPRFWWSDFPLENSAGKPYDLGSQNATLAGALQLLSTSQHPGVCTQSPQVWSDNEDWKRDFMDVASLTGEQIARLHSEHEETRAMKTKN